MPYRLLADDDTEYEVVRRPTMKQQRDLNRLQMRASFLPVEQKRQIAQAYQWTDEFTEDGTFSPPADLDVETFRIKAAHIVFEDFDAPISQDTRDRLYGGEVQQGVSDFLSRCGGQATAPQASSNGSTARQSVPRART